MTTSTFMLVLAASMVSSAVAVSCGTNATAWNDTGTPCTIAGYITGSNVVKHSMIDLDQKDIEALIAVGRPQDYAAAKTIYVNGSNSFKTTGMRTLKGFSKDLGTESTYVKFKTYWNDALYANTFVMKALDNTYATGRTPAGTAVERKELTKKGTAYQNSWMYTIHEFEDAVADCTASSISNNDAGVHAWDEGVAFYTGSAQITSTTSVAGGTGYQLYRLADKRCSNYGTCATANSDGKKTVGISDVNSKLGVQFALGRDALQAGNCAAGQAALDKIIPLMSIPLVQGMLRYAYKADATNGAVDKAKERAEGWAFAAAALPLIHSCDAATATLIRTNMDIATSVTGTASPIPAGYKKIWTETMKVVASGCLKFKCADLGGLVAGTSYTDGTSPCTDYVAPKDTSAGSTVTPLAAFVVAAAAILSTLA